MIPDDLFGWRHIWQRVCRWPEYYRPSQWAERFRVLGEKESSVPGPWSATRNRPLAQLADMAMLPHVRRATWIKPPQIGASQEFRNIFATIMDQDPGPTMFVMPTEDLARELINLHLIPMLKNTDRLQRHLTGMLHDLKQNQIMTARMVAKIGWATSAPSLAGFPARYLVADEVDKYPASLGADGSPKELAEARTRSFIGQEKFFEFSTPTNQYGPIAQSMQECSQVFRLWVPCPACHQLQLLAWKQVRWECDVEDKIQRAGKVEAEHLAYYECLYCKQRIHEIQRASMVRAGIWWPGTYDNPAAFGDPDPSVTDVVDGFDRGIWPKVPHVGAFYPGIASPWTPLHWIASRGIRSMGDRLAMLGFTNNVLGEIFMDKEIESIKAAAIEIKVSTAPPAKVVPRWAQVLILTVDTQKDHFWFVVRAWGYGFQNQIIDHGRVALFSDVEQIALRSKYPRAPVDGGAPSEAETMAPFFCLIDSGGGVSGDEIVGSRTNEVYQFTRQDPRRLIPVKGHPGGRAAAKPFYFSDINYSPKSVHLAPQEAMSIRLMLIDVNFYKSVLSNRINKSQDEIDYLGMNDAVGRDYTAQMTSEHRVMDQKTGKSTWQKISAAAANHYWDCEVYQCAGADMAQVHLLKPIDESKSLFAPAPVSVRQNRKPGGWRIGR